MHASRSILAAALALATSACAEARDPTGPGDPLFSAAGVTPQVIGSGHNQGAAGLREFTFHAVGTADGGARGSYKVVLPNGLFFEADVTCVSTTGNTGWVGGIIRDSNAAAVIIGSRSMFFAADNGEGAGVADVVSIAAFNAADGADLAFCANQPLALPTLQVTQGKVRVR